MGTELEWARAFADFATSLFLAGADRLAPLVTDAVAGLAPGCEQAALCLLDRHGGTVPAAATGESVSVADRIWHEAGDGPCPAAIRDGTLQRVPDLLRDERWTEASERAARATGLRCVLTVPVSAGADTLGALTMASRSPDALAAPAAEFGTILATHAGLGLACAAAHRRNTELAEAVRSGRLIGMALGIVMAQRKLTSQQAFDLLRRRSHQLNRKIREIAEETVATGQLPGGSGPATRREVRGETAR